MGRQLVTMATSRCTSSQSINICHFNARSIRNKMDEISYFTKQNNIHIITISETWLGPEFSDNYINLPNFQTVFRQDRNKNGGGVCIFVSDQLSCSRRSDLEIKARILSCCGLKYSFNNRPAHNIPCLSVAVTGPQTHPCISTRSSKLLWITW